MTQTTHIVHNVIKIVAKVNPHGFLSHPHVADNQGDPKKKHLEQGKMPFLISVLTFTENLKADRLANCPVFEFVKMNMFNRDNPYMLA